MYSNNFEIFKRNGRDRLKFMLSSQPFFFQTFALQPRMLITALSLITYVYVVMRWFISVVSEWVQAINVLM